MTRRRIAPGVVTDDRILVVVQPAEPRVVTPVLLHELELPLDVCVDAEEVDAGRFAPGHPADRADSLRQPARARPAAAGSPAMARTPVRGAAADAPPTCCVTAPPRKASDRRADWCGGCARRADRRGRPDPGDSRSRLDRVPRDGPHLARAPAVRRSATDPRIGLPGRPRRPDRRARRFVPPHRA